MIIHPNDSAVPTTDLKVQPAAETELATQNPPEETAPPSYYPSEQHATASTSSSLAQPMFKSKPTNYLNLFSEHSSVRGEYVIDPCMNIPTSLLPPLAPEESEADRKNLCVHSKTGSVNAEIWLLNTRDAQPFDSKTPTKRTTLDLGSEHSSVTARVQTIQGAAPFLLTMSTKHGAVHVALPHSFHGLLFLTTTHGSVSLADSISENCTYLSQVDMTRRYFIGDLTMVDDSDWTGDEVRVEATHGKIRVKYVDENTDISYKGGLLSRLFGW
ncbi:hypothetical protein K503DRAFT_768450 [Rhizopogon vinicolor AM-OR11-026]|uniref:DUF7330 domain-containing protein n=1 Tax=Rhizopogon vinicolor AM-OR11-026 TaxID=1314800 RepID=A0A1B7N6S6_9AGAM|nr:hypothetical protein K503DRAFT_768450 [Rhizopogon vinicolor AM-OR11-026]